MDFHDATLLIIGHGSTVNGDSGATVFQHAAELRRRGIFADVREGFFKIEPRIGAALAGIRTARIFVVPLFVSEGYFTQQAIPQELGLSAEALAQASSARGFEIGGRKLFYCAPVGTHPLMTEIILARARGVLGQPSGETGDANYHSASDGAAAPHPGPLPFRRGEGEKTPAPVAFRSSLSSTALIIAGHGTKLNADSRKSIERQVELIAAQKIFAEVHPAFLEESPRIGDIPRFVKASRIVVVPFFMSDGLHVCEDIPVLLGEEKEEVETRLKAGEWPWTNPTERGRKTIFYTRGVGSEKGIAEVILERVRAVGIGR